MRRMLLGVGNRLGRDDAVGPHIAAALSDSDWNAVDCGTALENASGLVAREAPELLVIVDAARMGLAPGSVRTMPIDFHDRMLASTHGLPLGFVMDRIRDRVGEILLIGIEPEDVSFGEGLTPPVERAAASIVECLRRNALDELLPFTASANG